MKFEQDKITKISEILNLSTTENRTNTIRSLVENILFSYNEELTRDEIINLVLEMFDIDLFKNEVEEVLAKLIDIDSISIKDNKYKISDAKYSEIHRLNVVNKTNEENRFERFDKLIREFETIDKEELKTLWTHFNYYLIECFYQYGENALKFFKVNGDDASDKLIDEKPFRNTITQFKDEKLKRIFKKLVEIFPSKLSVEDLNYLESLARKTLSFYSLGLPKELHEELTNLELVDWLIFVDTNFLYSILDLHTS